MKIKHFKKIITILIFILLLTTNISAVYADNSSKLYYIGGFPLGFDLSAEGALVVGLSEVICEDDIYLPAKDADIKPGDYILSLNGKKVTSAADIDEVLSNYESGFILAEILSGGEKQIKNIYPKKDLGGSYRLGLLIRDYLSGLGTVTIINENGEFCSLGHPITDEKGALLSVAGGVTYKCNITDVVKGKRGKAGELQGIIIRNEVLGAVTKNTEIGLIGKFTCYDDYKNIDKYEIGEACLGDAEIYTTIRGESPKKYSISIVKIDSGDKLNKNLMIKITDDKLIRYAGGIVQGMSGSPIIQNGKIVGAVTHVFLNDSTRGYGILIDKMVSSLN
ncbi:MAG: SpoIVB peptidase [Clostridia bacterium]|nr:SpoIVB peptidase [Clostridia bacterium]